jgi:hypothetical protein
MYEKVYMVMNVEEQKIMHISKDIVIANQLLNDLTDEWWLRAGHPIEYVLLECKMVDRR